MISIPEKISPAVQASNVTAALRGKISAPLSKETVYTINRGRERINNGRCAESRDTAFPNGPAGGQQMAHGRMPASTAGTQGERVLEYRPLPHFSVPVKKGQKVLLDRQNRGIRQLEICFGWNLLDPAFDVDASAFLVCENGRVPDDGWFVFYGQKKSPDQSTWLDSRRSNAAQSVIRIDLNRVAPQIKKIVFVVSINEAFEKKQNFGMLKDTYIQIRDAAASQELVSYQLEEYYTNVTSMTIGELYLHNGQWKFNPVGNGVNKDLAGQCAMYGVEING